METLFARHKPRKGMVGLMLAGSLVLHGGLVGIASLWTPPQPELHTVPMEIWPEDTNPGKPAELPPLALSEPPAATATPEVLDVQAAPPPPVTEDPDFAPPSEPTPLPHRTTTVKPTASSNRVTNALATSRVPAGPPGGGLPGGGNPAGMNNAWVMPHPPYPRVASAPRAVGNTTVRISTDATGRVSNVVIVQSTGSPVLDNHTASYVRNNWHGPPNASRTTQFVYEIR